MPELPVELIILILQRLPVKTLLQFRSVFKSIRNIIDSRNFINAHLNSTLDNRTHRKLIFPPFAGIDTYTGKFVVLDIDDDNFLQVFDIDDDFEPQFEYMCSSKFFAHCNGLILFGEHLFELKLGIWNPSTGKYKDLPPFKCTEYDNDSITEFGFGYDSISDDYKVLLLKSVFTRIKDDDEYHTSFNLHLEVLVLGLRSCRWRMIGKDLISKYRFRLHSSNVTNCFLDGAFYFLCGGKVFAFDLANETFSQISIPNFDRQVLESDDTNLQAFDGCLCITFLSSSDEEKQREFYVREKDGVEFSWTKLLSIPSEKNFWRVLAYSKERDKLFVLHDQPHLMFSDDDQHRSLYSYDLKDKSLQRIETADIPNSSGIFCIGSLVPVDYQVKKKSKKKAKKRTKYSWN